jgi:hypothetical protein
MRTPAGIECEYFYGDYLRGRNREECRLLDAAGLAWDASLCRACPVPGIRRANACQFIRLKPRVTRSLFSGFRRQVQVSAWCEKSATAVPEPHIGCGQCHPLPEIFEVKK